MTARHCLAFFCANLGTRDGRVWLWQTTVKVRMRSARNPLEQDEKIGGCGKKPAWSCDEKIGGVVGKKPPVVARKPQRIVARKSLGIVGKI